MKELGLAALTITMIVFGTSAAAKLRARAAYRSYRDGLREAELVPGRLLPATAAVLASFEVLVAASSASAVVLRAVTEPAGAVLASWTALAAAFALTSVLLAGVAVAIRRGTRASCACFGSASARPLGAAQLARNSSLLIVMVAGLVGQGLGRGSQVPAEAAVGIAAGAVIALMLIRLDDLIDLFAPSSVS